MTVKVSAGREQSRKQGAPPKFKRHAVHPRSPWDVIIDVYLNSIDGGVGSFDIESCLPKARGSGGAHPEIQFDNAGRPGFRITFRLFDNTNGGSGSNYQFPQRAEDGVWSKTGTDCPTAAVYDIFPEKTLKVSKDGRSLVAFNPNPAPAQGRFRYTLNVAIAGSGPYVALDPGGNNMDGGWN